MLQNDSIRQIQKAVDPEIKHVCIWPRCAYITTLAIGATHFTRQPEAATKREKLQREKSIPWFLTTSSIDCLPLSLSLSPSICGRADRESLISQGHPVETFAGDGGDPRVQVLAESVALGSRGTRVPHEVEGLERSESTQQLAHLNIKAPTRDARIKAPRAVPKQWIGGIYGKIQQQNNGNNAWPSEISRFPDRFGYTG